MHHSEVSDNIKCKAARDNEQMLVASVEQLNTDQLRRGAVRSGAAADVRNCNNYLPSLAAASPTRRPAKLSVLLEFQVIIINPRRAFRHKLIKDHYTFVTLLTAMTD